jgi:glucose/arabinose dehydrogenase
MLKLVLLLSLAATAAGTVLAQALPAGLRDQIIVDQLDQPTAIAFAPDGRLFICEKTGSIKVFKSGALNAAPFINLNVSSDSERGVLGIAFDPDFSNRHYVYVYYTTNALSLSAPPTPKNRVSRFTASGDSAVAGSEVILLDNIPSDAGNHNGGCIRFGIDGNLYVGTGDGGQTHTNSQDLASLAGKILRIRSDGTIPSDNPFFGQAGKRGEIFCYGLRNPFRFSFRPGTSTMYIGDVGQGTWEEVDLGVAAANYGWPNSEGPDNASGYTAPLFYYNHNGVGAAIVGGCFLTDMSFAHPYYGGYFFADYEQSKLGLLQVSSSNALLASSFLGSAPTPVDFANGPAGGLWYPSVGAGQVREITYQALLKGLVATTQTVQGGNYVPLRVDLDVAAPMAGKSILLSTSNNALATVPATTVVPADKKSVFFSAATKPVARQANVTISATADGVVKTSTLTLVPPRMSSLVVAPSSVPGGGYTTGTINLTGNAPAGGALCSIISDSSAVLVPTGVTVPAGAHVATFTINTAVVNAAATRHVTAAFGGISKVASVTVTPEVTLKSLTLNPESVVGGQASDGTVVLTKVSTSDVVVSLSDDTSAASEPASVTVKAGKLSASFVVSTSRVSTTQSRHVFATLGTIRRTAPFTITVTEQP